MEFFCVFSIISWWDYGENNSNEWQILTIFDLFSKYWVLPFFTAELPNGRYEKLGKEGTI